LVEGTAIKEFFQIIHELSRKSALVRGDDASGGKPTWSGARTADDEAATPLVSGAGGGQGGARETGAEVGLSYGGALAAIVESGDWPDCESPGAEGWRR